jgi:multidrug resistance efflux pump
MLNIRIFIGLVMILFVLFLAGCGSNKEARKENPTDVAIEPVRIVGIGRIEPELKILEITSQTSGIVTQISFFPGETVDKGLIILELDSAVEKARLEQASARIQTQFSQIQAARAALASVRIKAENARLTYERTKNLFEQGTETQFSFDLAETEYKSLLEETKRWEAEAQSAERLVRQYRADLMLAQAEYEKRFIKAPTDGQLLSLDITLGSLVTPQKSLGTFAPESPLSAWCEIDELLATQLQIGQKAYVRQQGTTEPLAHGTVSFVGPYLRRKSIFSDEVGDLQDRRVREIRITLDQDANILIGSRVECVILLQDN